MSWQIKKRLKDLVSAERGTILKDPGGKVRVCIVYPNRYALGMSNLGFQTAYMLFNNLPGCLCERAFLPDEGDLKEHLRTETPLLSLESQAPVRDFDIIAFSIPFEDDYANIPSIMGLAGVPLRSRDRGEGSPLVMAGGVAVSLNPEPSADFFDVILIGEGEERVERIIDLYEGADERAVLLSAFAEEPSFYVPSFYQPAYDGDRLVSLNTGKAPGRIRASKAFNLDRFPLPESFISTPFTEFGGARLIEIERGCGRGCRFCAAGFLYMPPRWRGKDPVVEAVRRGASKEGKVGLIGTAVSEYPGISEVIEAGVEAGGTVTLSSLRLECLNGQVLGLLKKGGLKTVTLAPEAATVRMRAIINKGMTDSEIIEAARLIKDAGLRKVKLYFIAGLPFETDDDASAIAGLSIDIKNALGPGAEITLSVNPFVPKPFTPFQWHPFEAADVIERRLGLVKKSLSKTGIRVATGSVRESLIQAFVSRADRRAGAFIEEAARKGWPAVLKANKDFVMSSVFRERERDELLPWDHLDHGVKKGYLWKEYERASKGELTQPCSVGRCFRCGICSEGFLSN